MHNIIEYIFIDDVADASSGRANNDMDLKSVLPYLYEFIPSDNSLLVNEGECVIDQVSKICGDQINALRGNKLIERIANLKNSYWQVAAGVRARTINGILKSHDISYYSYDINTRCVDKFISKNGNYPALVCYSVNNHMYIDQERKKAQSLIERAKDIETNIKTYMIEEKMEG